MTQHFNSYKQILEYLEKVKSDIESGNPSRELKYKPELTKEKLSEAREKLTNFTRAIERMKEDPSEVMDRMNATMTAIETEYSKEAKFLKILIEQKLAPNDFHEKVVQLMCDISDAQNGLVGPHAALAAANNYVQVLEILRNDKTLSAEMDNVLAGKS